MSDKDLREIVIRAKLEVIRELIIKLQIQHDGLREQIANPLVEEV